MKKKTISRPRKLASPSLQYQASPRQRILVVEDDVDICQLNCDVLRESGYHVDSALDGRTAWQVLKSDRYDLLITNHSMPMMTGLELINNVRSKSMQLPVILTSGLMPTEKIKQQPWLQIQATLRKPYTLTELFLLVREILNVPDITSGRATPLQSRKSRTANASLNLKRRLQPAKSKFRQL